MDRGLTGRDGALNAAVAAVPARALSVPLVLVSTFIDFRGASDWDVFLQADQPGNIDKYPSRVSDWGDMQILRGL
jgi:hypothetical protein